VPEPTAPAAGTTVQIPLQRSRAVITPETISIRPARSQLLVPFAQALVTAVAVWVMVAFMNALPLWLLVVLLMVSIIIGPAAVLGFVYNVYGTEFLVERRKGTARWHQGFLGLGIGTFELVPFERIARVEVQSNLDDDLTSGQLQDFIELNVRIVKDNGRVLDVASVTSAYAFIEDAADRVNGLAAALAEMAGQAVVTFEVPEAVLAAPVRASKRRSGRRRVARPRTEV
jgi:ABC-type transport system involved in cytochrome bd biosynthesis fused ATPase/permease subunit